jgi:hypothetical protein
MNIKSLLFGSAAALVAVSGARAADAVVVAEPEPAEYVKICDVYGAGYYYIPGTETCLNIGGYVRVTIGAGSNKTGYQGAGLTGGVQDVIDKKDAALDGDMTLKNDTWSWQTKADVHFDARSETELGTLRSYFEASFNNTSARAGVWDNAGTPETGDDVRVGRMSASSTGWALEHAYIQLAGLTVGYSDSLFESITESAGALVINDSIVGYTPGKANFIAYTFDAGNGFAATLGLEAGAGENYIDSYTPHVVVGATYTQGWGSIEGVIGYDSNFGKLAGKLRVNVKVNDQLSAWVMGGLSSGDDGDDLLNHYNTWSGKWALWGGLDYKFSDKGTLYGQVSYTPGNDFGIVGGAPAASDIINFANGDPTAFGEFSKDIWGAAVGVSYNLVPGFNIKPEVAYASGKSIVDGHRADDWAFNVRFQRSF